MHIATNESCPLLVDNFTRLISDGTHLYGKHTAIIGAPALTTTALPVTITTGDGRPTVVS